MQTSGINFARPIQAVSKTQFAAHHGCNGVVADLDQPQIPGLRGGVSGVGMGQADAPIIGHPLQPLESHDVEELEDADAQNDGSGAKKNGRFEKGQAHGTS